MDVYFVIVLSVFDFEEGPLDDEVDHVCDIYQDEQDDLNDWICEGYGKEDCCKQLVEVVQQGLGDVPRTNFGLNGIWENYKLIDPWLA